MPKPTREQLLAALKAPQKKVRVKEGDSKYTAEEKAQMDAEGRGLGAKSKEWAEKFARMNDTETWLCLCWRDEAKVDAFLSRWLLGDHDRLVDASELANTLGLDLDTPVEQLPPRKLRRFTPDKDAVRRKLAYQPHPSPPEREESDDFAADVAAELDDLLRWAQDPRWLAEHGEIVDHPHYVCLYFGSRERVDVFLRLTGLIDLGDKYLDGDQANELLGELV